MLKVVRFFTLLLLLVLSFSAQSRDALEGQWKFKFGDHPQWAQVDWDDRAWPSIKVPSIIPQRHGQAITGWYRLHFDTARFNTSTQQALLIEYLRHSDETWLNGVKIGGKGDFFKPWDFSPTNPQSLVRAYKIPNHLLKPSNNVLAIKVSVGFGQALGAMFPGGAGIVKGGVYIGNVNQIESDAQKSLLTTISLDSAFIILGVVDILIIIFLLKNTLNRFREFKWLVLSSFIMTIGGAGHDFFYIYPSLLLISSNLLLILALLITPFSIAMFFWSQHRNLRIPTVQKIFLAWALLCILILAPNIPDHVKEVAWYIWSILTIGFFIYAFYCAIKSVVLWRIGAISQLLALTMYAFSIRTQWLPDIFFEHRNIQIGSLFYRYALLYTYAMQIRYLRIDYKAISKRLVNIVDETRNSTARELHDGLGQHLATLKLHVKLLKMQVSSSHFKVIEDELENAITGLRRLINGLHPTAIDNHSIYEAIKKECLRLENIHEVSITFEHLHSTVLDKTSASHTFRIFQECVGNSIRHGKATHINIKLSMSDHDVTLVVKDNGIGFEAKNTPKREQARGFGLISLHERVALLNGRIDIHSHKNAGTESSVRFRINQTTA